VQVLSGQVQGIGLAAHLFLDYIMHHFFRVQALHVLLNLLDLVWPNDENKFDILGVRQGVELLEDVIEHSLAGQGD